MEEKKMDYNEKVEMLLQIVAEERKKSAKLEAELNDAEKQRDDASSRAYNWETKWAELDYALKKRDKKDG